MKKIICSFLCALFLFTSTEAQYTLVQFDYEMLSFNENKPLPSEVKLVFSGDAGQATDMVEVKIFGNKNKDNREALATGFWKRREVEGATTFKVPVNYKLQAAKKYDLHVNYYKSISDAERQQLYAALSNNLDAYLSQSFGAGKKSIKLSSKTKQVMHDINQIVVQALAPYRNTSNAYHFEGFSDIVRQKLEAIEDAKLTNAKNVVNVEDKHAARLQYRDQLTGELKKLVRSELAFSLNTELVKLVDRREIEDYETEKRPGYFAVNVGYGAVYLDGNIDNLTYGTSPYIGLSFPLATSTLAPKFFRNASFAFGIFMSNLENENDEKVTGPIIKRPFYFGLDYKLFQFVRFNAGGVLLEEQEGSGGPVSELSNRIFVQPFIGLSARFNIQLSLEK